MFLFCVFIGGNKEGRGIVEEFVVLDVVSMDTLFYLNRKERQH